jgi:hypothetical protein
LWVVEATTDLDGFAETCLCGGDVSLEHQPERGAVAKVALLHAIDLAVIEQPLCPIDPTPAAGQFASVEKNERQPEGTARGSRNVGPLGTVVVGCRPELHALVGPPDQIGGRCLSLEIVDVERRVVSGGRQMNERVRPRVVGESLTPALDLLGHAHTLAYAKRDLRDRFR